MAEPVTAIARVSTVLWVRELSATLRVSRRHVVLAAVLALAGAVAAGVVFGALTVADVAPALPAAARQAIVATAFTGTVVMAGLVTAVLCLVSPRHTLLGTLLALLPVRRWAAALGQFLPMTGFALAVSLALSGSGVALVVQTASGPGEAVAGVVAAVAVVVLTTALGLGLFLLFRSALERVLHLPNQYAAVGAGTLTAVAFLAVWGRLLLAYDPHPEPRPPLLFSDAAAALATSAPEPLAPVSLLGWTVGSALLLWLASSLDQTDLTRRAPLWLARVRGPRSRFAAAAWAEFLTAVRAPQTLVLALLQLLAAIGLIALARQPLLATMVPSLFQALVVASCFLGIYAVGRTRSTNWLGTHLLADAEWWPGPQAAAYGVLVLAQVGLVASIGVWAGVLGTSALPAVGTIALGVPAALLGGSLAPFRDDQPLSTAAAGMAAGLIAVVGQALLSRIPASAPVVVGVAVTVALAAVTVAGYRWSAALHVNGWAQACPAD